ncbi:MAG: peptidylprolyl isomerase [Acidobacteria bacterium]|jgi:parvulin-like peptidyl-prolyl isomerase|nr:MAG: peptidylprolyl isomerase [Acidobacteriota bacterium]
MKFLSILLLSGGFANAADVSVMEEIVCKVNGDIITRTELERDRKQLESEFRQQGLTGSRLQDAVNSRAKDLLRDRIDRLLLISKGKELDVKVDPDVAKRLAEIQRKAGIADPEKFQQFVREQTGMPFEDYKNDLKNQLITERVIRQEVSSKIQVPRAELEKYYNEHKSEFQRKERVFLREILVSTEGKDAAGIAAAEKKAKDLSARARKGERFGELAQSNSDAPSAQQGGEMPPFEKGQLLKEIDDVVWNQPRGYVTDPIKLPQGFEVLRVEEHHKAGLAEFEEVENEVMEKLFQPRFDPEVRKYLTKLRQDAFLEIKPGFEDSGAAPGKNTAWTDPAQLKPETITKEEVASKTRHKKLLWAIPIPGTSTKKTGTSSSR